MNREQILKQAQKENRGADLAEVEVQKKGNAIGFIVTFIVTLIIMLVEWIITGTFSVKYFAIISSMLATMCLYYYIKIENKWYLIIGIVLVVATLAFILFWLLNLAVVFISSLIR